MKINRLVSVRGWLDGVEQLPMAVVAVTAGALLVGFGMRMFRRAETH